MSEEKKTGLALLREPFPANQISKLPKPFKKDSPKGKCPECGGFHGLPAAHLDYVGHAALTDRLLEADLNWTWEPMAIDEQGLPRFDKSGGLWIKLTVRDQTRLGYGHAENSGYKEIGAREKEVIGDALRNAAMRFGAALDLWHKGDLHVDMDQGDISGKIPNDSGEGSEARGLQGAAKSVPKATGGKPATQGADPGNGPPPSAKPGNEQLPAQSSAQAKSTDITVAQAKRLFAIASGVKWQEATIKKVLKEAFGLDSSLKLNRVQYEALIKLIQADVHPDQVIERLLLIGGPK